MDLSTETSKHSERKYEKFDRCNISKVVSSNIGGGSVVPASSSRDTTISTWSQLFLRRTWIDTGFEDDFDDYDDKDELISFKELIKYSFIKFGHDLCNFCKTCVKNPLILLYSFICLIVLCGGGFGLIYYFKESYTQTRKNFAMNM